jgi:hypothetical protein
MWPRLRRSPEERMFIAPTNQLARGVGGRPASRPDSSGEPGRGEALEEAVVVREPIGSGRPQARVGLPRLSRLD